MDEARELVMKAINANINAANEANKPLFERLAQLDALTTPTPPTMCASCFRVVAPGIQCPVCHPQRPFPEMLDSAEERALLTRAETLWSDLQTNQLGGFSGVNRPFYIVAEFRRVIEEFTSRDTGLQWSKNQLDTHPDNPSKREILNEKP